MAWEEPSLESGARDRAAKPHWRSILGRGLAALVSFLPWSQSKGAAPKEAASDRKPAGLLEEVTTECHRALPIIILFSLFLNLLVLTSPLYMLQMFDRVLSSGRVETLFYLTVIAGIAIAVMGILDAVRSRLLARTGQWLERRLGPDVISVSIGQTLRGQALGNQPLRDVAAISGFITGQGLKVMLDAPWVPLFLLVIWALHPLLGVIGVAAALVLIAVALLNEILSRKPLMQAGELSLKAYQHAGAALRNADVVQAMGMLPGLVRRWQAENDQVLEQQLIAGDRNAGLMGFSHAFRAFAQVGLLGAGAYLVLAGELTPGGMIAASILMGRALSPVEQSIGAWRGVVSARAAHARLEGLLAADGRRDVMPLPAPEGHLACERLVYLPAGREVPVLNGVSFALEAGEMLGIVGPSAAGKSTLCRLLVGATEPSRGHVRIDGADLGSWRAEDLGRHIGYLPQDVELLEGTIQENIARLAPKPDAEDVVRAARAAGVHDLILRLPQGYDTVLGGARNPLSGGERQRIGLARAFYGEPCLIVLDEPNANLDAEGETALLSAIDAAKSWRATIVLVAHQPRILRPADKVLLLRGGRVETIGARDEVLKNLGPVRLAAAQDQPDPRPAAAAGRAEEQDG